MKRIYEIITALAVFAMLFASCKEDDPSETTPEAVFPELKELTSKAGEKLAFSFVASHDWTLASDKMWCTFETPADNLISTAGKAGGNSVTIVIGSEGLDFDKTSVATITMSMGGKTAAVAAVSRLPKEYELAVYDMQGNELKALTAGYGTSLPFVVKANFSFSAVSWDEEAFSLDGDHISGGLGEDAVGGLTIVCDGNREKYPIEASDNYSLTFSDPDGKAAFKYPVIYGGMDPEAIGVTGLDYSAGWNVNPSATRFSHQISGEDSLHVDGGIEFNVVSLEDEFEVLVLNSASKAEVGWVKTVKKGASVSVSCEPNEEEFYRTANVYVLPKALYDRLGDKVIESIGGESTDSYQLRNKCLALNLTQAYVKKEVPDEVSSPIAISMDFLMPWDFSGANADKWNSEWPEEWKDNWPEEKDFPYVLPVRRTDDKALMEKYDVASVFEYDYFTFLGTSYSNFIVPNVEGWTIDAFQAPDDPSEHESKDVAACTMYYMGRNLTQEMMEDLEGRKEWYTPQELSGFRVIGFKNGYKFFGIEITYGNFAEEDNGVWKEPVYIVFSVNNANVKLVVVNPPVNQ